MNKEIEVRLLAAEPSQECVDEVLPLERSMSGSNAYYIHCDAYQGRSNYAVCLHTIEVQRKGTLHLRSACGSPIECGSCPALGMRKREEQAGRAMFFVDRQKILAKLSEEVSQPSEVVAYGKRGSALAAFRTNKASEEEVQSFERSLKRKDLDRRIDAKVQQKKEGGVDVGLVDRNMLGDAINRMMEGSK